MLSSFSDLAGKVRSACSQKSKVLIGKGFMIFGLVTYLRRAALGDDSINGGEGVDYLYGEDGNDYIINRTVLT